MIRLLRDMSQKPNNKIKELLDRLATESWQLELVVSGFVIFLVGGSFDGISHLAKRIRVIEDGLGMKIEFLSIFPIILKGCALFVFINLILHVVFRGMWISAIGLRSISGDIDFEELKFNKPFDRFLKKKLGSFDKYIQKLEDISSVIFAFTFLIIFMMISVALFLLSFLFFIYFIDRFGGIIPEALEMLIFALVPVFLLFGLFYFLDFLTLGYFKRKRWIAKWYFPIYRLMSVITFSWFYRPLYYNLVDNRFGKRVGLLLVPYFLGVVIFATSATNINQFFPEDAENLSLNNFYYEDMRDEMERIRKLSIPSKYIKNGFLELFLVYDAVNDDEVIEQKYPGFRVEKEIGFQTDINISINDDNEEVITYTSADSLLIAVSSLYEIKIDTTVYTDPDFFFYVNERFGEQGLKTVIDLEKLKRGKHTLTIRHLSYNYGLMKPVWQPYATVPFWIE